jgi:hypothetical protein
MKQLPLRGKVLEDTPQYLSSHKDRLEGFKPEDFYKGKELAENGQKQSFKGDDQSFLNPEGIQRQGYKSRISLKTLPPFSTGDSENKA